MCGPRLEDPCSSLRSRFLLKVNQVSSYLLKLHGHGTSMALTVWFLRLRVGSRQFCRSSLESSIQPHQTPPFCSNLWLCLLAGISCQQCTFGGHPGALSFWKSPLRRAAWLSGRCTQSTGIAGRPRGSPAHRRRARSAAPCP